MTRSVLNPFSATFLAGLMTTFTWIVASSQVIGGIPSKSPKCKRLEFSTDDEIKSWFGTRAKTGVASMKSDKCYLRELKQDRNRRIQRGQIGLAKRINKKVNHLQVLLRHQAMRRKKIKFSGDWRVVYDDLPNDPRFYDLTYHRNNDFLEGTITLPNGLKAYFVGFVKFEKVQSKEYYQSTPGGGFGSGGICPGSVKYHSAQRFFLKCDGQPAVGFRVN